MFCKVIHCILFIIVIVFAIPTRSVLQCAMAVIVVHVWKHSNKLCLFVLQVHLMMSGFLQFKQSGHIPHVCRPQAHLEPAPHPPPLPLLHIQEVEVEVEAEQELDLHYREGVLHHHLLVKKKAGMMLQMQMRTQFYSCLLQKDHQDLSSLRVQHIHHLSFSATFLPHLLLTWS